MNDVRTTSSRGSSAFKTRGLAQIDDAGRIQVYDARIKLPVRCMSAM